MQSYSRGTVVGFSIDRSYSGKFHIGHRNELDLPCRLLGICGQHEIEEGRDGSTAIS
jgi:hypothetical protein